MISLVNREWRGVIALIWPAFLMAVSGMRNGNTASKICGVVVTSHSYLLRWIERAAAGDVGRRDEMTSDRFWKDYNDRDRGKDKMPLEQKNNWLQKKVRRRQRRSLPFSFPSRFRKSLPSPV